jgi:hypothetical protein
MEVVEKPFQAIFTHSDLVTLYLDNVREYVQYCRQSGQRLNSWMKSRQKSSNLQITQPLQFSNCTVYTVKKKGGVSLLHKLFFFERGCLSNNEIGG